MFTCGECVDVECIGHESPEQPACDEFTTEMWEDAVPMDDIMFVQTAWDEERIADIEEQITQLSELVCSMERVFSAMNHAYMEATDETT